MIPHPFEKTGGVKNPKDKRDYLLSRVQVPAPFPPIYLPDISSLPILMQGQKPACTAHAAVWGLMYQDYLQTKEVRDYTPRFLYALAKRDDNFAGDGTYMRVVLKEAQDNGICLNRFFPNDITLDTSLYQDVGRIPTEAYTDATPRKIQSYATLDDLSFEGLKGAIYANKGVFLGVSVGREWWSDINGTISWQEKDILPLRVPQTIISGHEVYAYGYDEKYIYFVNSFSNSWGRGGVGYFNESYLPFVYQGMTMVEVSDEVIAKLKEQVSLLQRIINLLKSILGLSVKTLN